jgi:hypothetical protein
MDESPTREVTEVVFNRGEIPQHPANTTSRKVERILEVLDAKDGTRCTAGLGRNELNLLMNGQPILPHLYKYVAINGRVYTTRETGVILVVKCRSDEPEASTIQP